MDNQNKKIEIGKYEFQMPFVYDEKRDVIRDSDLGFGLCVPTGEEERKVAIGQYLADALNFAEAIKQAWAESKDGRIFDAHATRLMYEYFGEQNGK